MAKPCRHEISRDVAKFLGLDPAALTAHQRRLIAECIRRGRDLFRNPPPFKEWSF